jgi:hypothetical protein
VTRRRQNAEAKGRRIVQLARKLLEARGASVEVAPKVVHWLPKPDGSGGRVPLSTRHDFFGWADLLVCFPDGERGLFQVTTWEHVSDRRQKMLARGFPYTAADAILGYVAGRNRHFRVLRGPAFEEWTGETWRPVKEETP